MTIQEVETTMLERGYDIVPVVNKRGEVKSYLNEKLYNSQIENEDKLYYLTHVNDAIWQMNKEKRTHYFLSNGKDKNDIVGLLSLSNFNGREFYIFLFNIIAYVEQGLASLIKSDAEKGFKILNDNAMGNEELEAQLKLVKERYEEDKKVDNENDFKEYLYLNHLTRLICAEEKYKVLGYKREEDFLKHTGIIREIRNTVAHPVKSLVKNFTDLKRLHSGLFKLYELRSKMENIPIR